MIYCFKRLKKLKLLHIFFLHYGISLVVGGSVIAGLFWLGGGLQIYSIVVLLNMYNQPAIFMLRRMMVYEIRAELRNESSSLDDKFSFAIEAAFVKPQPDFDFFYNAVVLGGSAVAFFATNGLLLLESKFSASVWIAYSDVIIFSLVLELAESGLICNLENKAR